MPGHPTARFSDRADAYVRARPSYPEALYDAMLAGRSHRSAADVGSGTGISTEPLLRRGLTVHAVEPNAAMRASAESRFIGQAAIFTSVDGSAEATTLPDASVDLVTVAQAFHWMDAARARGEFRRVLVRAGVVALYWNWRRTGGSPFLDGYEALLQRWGVDYAAVKQGYRVRETLASFFGGPFVTRVFPHARALDRDGIRTLLQSASYVPGAGHPMRAPMLDALDALFDATAEDGAVEMVYDAELFVGGLA